MQSKREANKDDARKSICGSKKILKLVWARRGTKTKIKVKKQAKIKVRKW
jgi:hypothetical protein